MAGGLSRWMTRTLARTLTSVFFREVRVEGLESIPTEGPLVYAGNHPNSMVDPLIMHAVLPRNPRFLARHGLWDIAVVRPFVRMAGSIPVYRQQDRDGSVVQNLETFSACYEALAAGAAIGIFPEGKSHSEPSMAPVKTGIARIVLGAEKEKGPLGIRIVPVGLTFDAKQYFRSRVLVAIGKPVGPVDEIPADKGDFRRLRNALTKEVEEALRSVTLNYGTAREARLLERAGDLYAKTPSELPDRPGLSDLFEVRKQFAEGYDVMRERLPERVAVLARDIDAYDRMLRFTGFTDEQVVSSYPRGRIYGYLARTIGRLYLFLPLALIGIFFNWLPYQLTSLSAKGLGKKPETPATRKIFGGFFVFPIVWILWAALTGWLLGWKWFVFVIFLAPLSAWSAMRFKEESESFWAESFNYMRLRTHRQTWEELGKRRRELSEEISALAKDYLDNIPAE